MSLSFCAKKALAFAPDFMKFVTFHIKPGSSIPQPAPYPRPTSAHSELIPLFLDSIRRTHPSAEIVMLTDLDSNFDEGFDQIIRHKIEPQKLMLDRLKAQRAFLASERFDGPIVMLDTDILGNRNLASTFASDYDVGVTIQDDPRFPSEVDMPYNNGVVFVRNERCQAVLRYFDRLIELIQAMPQPLHAWFGNQYAVRDLLGRLQPDEIVQIEAARIKVFPCSLYNYAPEFVEEEVSGKYILHFRGRKKRLMPAFARKLSFGSV